MRKLNVFLLASFFTSITGFAQVTDTTIRYEPNIATTQIRTTPISGVSPAKVVFAEAGGPGLLSVNYDMRFTRTHDGFGFRAGFGGWAINDSRLVLIPVGLNYITSKNQRDYFEAGAGATFVSNSRSSEGDTGPFKKSFGFLTIGYRKQPAEGGLFYKVALVPVFGQGFFWPYYAAAGIGYTF